MPSLHIAWALWCTLVLWSVSKRRWLRVLAVLYPCVTALSVLATGNHFVLDIFAGLLVLAVAAAIVRLASRWKELPLLDAALAPVRARLGTARS
jgi:hypothetical protein